ncbi:MAG: 3-phosphoshikimate 1-carboxyvinyltransferase [Oceanospirillaceae bacterium]|nr:3-phosphoshikimate 1-carboxyvinyltransferase [Oceanospirillaceae bacterium]
MQSLTLEPIAKVDGNVQIPGSKSLSNRILLLAAMASGETTITNLLDSDDIRRMLESLTALGVSYQLSDNNTRCTVQGLGSSFNTDNAQLFLGNAGTAMRPITAALCVGGGDYELTGDPRMYERPIGDLVDALRQLGADVTYLKDENYPPLKIVGTGLKGGEVSIKGSISSQFLTALLMAAPFAADDLTIVVDGELVSKPYIDITIDVMRSFGVQVINDNYQRLSIKAGQTYQAPGSIMVEGDASSASYFLAAAAIKGGKVRVDGVGSESVQGDKLFAKVLEKMGATVHYGPTYIEVTRNGPLTAVDLDLNHIPDAAMTIATTALFASGTTAIRNIYNWRVKETDRLYAMATELRKVGAEVVEGKDFIEITPPAQIKHANIDTYDDHRIAMCFALVALSDTAVTINDPGCTAKTLPNFFELFASISQK